MSRSCCLPYGESYETLAAQYDVVVLEGAGSPAEINLKQHDIVNMRMAEIADASCILVGDIDRGGVFASLLGTIELLDPAEQDRICGFVINKFRGDVKLLEPGIRMIEDRIRKPCLGVVPHMSQLALEEEDALGLPATADVDGIAWHISTDLDRTLRVAVIALPSFSNFTDFDALRSEPSVSLRFCRNRAHLEAADVVILPGTKQTVDDLLWLRAEGLDAALLDHARTSLVVGICGGMQMLGETIVDPHAMESIGSSIGLGLLPIQTNMQAQKITRQATGRLSTPLLFGQRAPDVSLSGYEIHIGETLFLKQTQPFAQITRQSSDEAPPIHQDGCISADTRIFGTYLHGLFDEDGFRHFFIAAARAFHQLNPAIVFDNWKQKREESFDHLASTVRNSLDMQRIFAWAGLAYRSEQQTKDAEGDR